MPCFALMVSPRRRRRLIPCQMAVRLTPACAAKRPPEWRELSSRHSNKALLSIASRGHSAARAPGRGGTMGRAGSEHHSLQEPAYNRGMGWPAQTAANKLWHAVTPEPQ